MRTLHIDGEPFRVRPQDVKQVHMFDVPTELRAYAAEIIDTLPMGEWYTLGVFTDAGGMLPDTAVVRRTRRAGRVVLEYGVEC